MNILFLDNIKQRLKQNQTIVKIWNKINLYKNRIYAILKLKSNKKNTHIDYSCEESYAYLNSIKKNKYKDIDCYSFRNEIKFDLSIIIPAYNVEKYIKDCIDSVINQITKYTYEIIIVNDGSKDDTLKILNEYMENENLTIINQENRGLSGARNSAIDICKGRYIMFVDSDDIILDNCIQSLLECGYENNADIVEGKYRNFTFKEELNDVGKKVKNDLNIYQYDIDSKFILKCDGFAWGKIYNRELWNGVRFPEGLTFEDTIIKFILARNSKKYIMIDNLIYGYRYNPTSITATACKNYTGLDSLYIMLYLLQDREKLKVKEDSILYILTIYQLSKYLYNRTSNFDDELLLHILVISKQILISIKEYRPKKIGFWMKNIEKSILDLDIENWKLFSKCL